MRRFYGILLIIVGLIFLLVFRGQLVQGLMILTGGGDHLINGSQTEPALALTALSYTIPLAAIGIGITTLIRDITRKNS